MQVSDYLRRSTDGYTHWCPGCEQTHGIPTPRWTFDGNLQSPTFAPSVNITGVQEDSEGKFVPYCCHYVITSGQVQFITDCTHKLAGQTVSLPPLPDFLRDSQ